MGKNKKLITFAIPSLGWSDRILEHAKNHKDCNVVAYINFRNEYEKSQFELPYYNPDEYKNLTIVIQQNPGKGLLDIRLEIMEWFYHNQENSFSRLIIGDCDDDYEFSAKDLYHYSTEYSPNSIIKFDYEYYNENDEVHKRASDYDICIHKRDSSKDIPFRNGISTTLFKRESVRRIMNAAFKIRQRYKLESYGVFMGEDTFITLLATHECDVHHVNVKICRYYYKKEGYSPKYIRDIGILWDLIGKPIPELNNLIISEVRSILITSFRYLLNHLNPNEVENFKRYIHN